ncbi:SIR2 family protein [Methylomonas paludis]|uniref:SIR2 family protein n=1 Tax=Methylomonas paludis TaxID=1173101 RepID=A0A975MNT1_9GAMM|nr:SIR2 family protein [Methylomonas paludis]QWF71281.1 SIR2 family protein [Methylomonas paludis]
MSNTVFSEILSGLYDNTVVPYLGPGVLFDSVNKVSGEPIPADSNSLILAMNGGKPMAPKLMFEFPRAAMNQELKRGRAFLTQFLDKVYGQTEWSRASAHDWVAEWRPKYVIDINRDTQLQDTYADEEHTLIVGLSRVIGAAFRYRIYHYDGSSYFEIPEQQVDKNLPILFKPMGTPKPESSYVASDADYVDYITELMGGFAIPGFLKEYREGKKYLLLGLPLNRDSERMVMSDIVYGAAEHKGWFIRKNPTDKEKRFSERMGFELIEADCQEFLAVAHNRVSEAA